MQKARGMNTYLKAMRATSAGIKNAQSRSGNHYC